MTNPTRKPTPAQARLLNEAIEAIGNQAGKIRVGVRQPTRDIMIAAGWIEERDTEGYYTSRDFITAAGRIAVGRADTVAIEDVEVGDLLGYIGHPGCVIRVVEVLDSGRSFMADYVTQCGSCRHSIPTDVVNRYAPRPSSEDTMRHYAYTLTTLDSDQASEVRGFERSRQARETWREAVYARAVQIDAASPHMGRAADELRAEAHVEAFVELRDRAHADALLEDAARWVRADVAENGPTPTWADGIPADPAPTAPATNELGFRPVPWAFRPPVDRFTDMPAMDRTEWDGVEEFCRERWDAEDFMCTRPIDHTGTCRAGTGSRIVAEWWAGRLPGRPVGTAAGEASEVVEAPAAGAAPTTTAREVEELAYDAAQGDPNATWRLRELAERAGVLIRPGGWVYRNGDRNEAPLCQGWTEFAWQVAHGALASVVERMVIAANTDAVERAGREVAMNGIKNLAPGTVGAGKSAPTVASMRRVAGYAPGELVHLLPRYGDGIACGIVGDVRVTETLSVATCPRCQYEGDPAPRTRALQVARAHGESLAEDAARTMSTSLPACTSPDVPGDHAYECNPAEVEASVAANGGYDLWERCGRPATDRVHAEPVTSIIVSYPAQARPATAADLTFGELSVIRGALSADLGATRALGVDGYAELVRKLDQLGERILERAFGH